MASSSSSIFRASVLLTLLNMLVRSSITSARDGLLSLSVSCVSLLQSLPVSCVRVLSSVCLSMYCFTAMAVV